VEPNFYTSGIKIMKGFRNFAELSTRVQFQNPILWKATCCLNPRASLGRFSYHQASPEPTLYDGYDLIVGNHSTGKATLVRLVGHKNSGIVYVDVLLKSPFEGDFAEALRWSPEIQTLGHVLAEGLFGYKEPEKGEIL
jgi:hypothetical protein